MTVTPNQPEPSPRPSGDIAPASAETSSGTPTLTPGRLGLLLVVVMLDLLGIGILIPVLPYIVKQFTDNAMIAGVLGTAYALCQFLATPILGSISDRVGRRPVLVLSLFGSAIGYVIFGLAGALYVLFIGRIIDGITGGNISTAYAYAADCTKPAQRARTFGLLGAAMGLGFIIGPAIGGWLSTQSLAVGSIKVDGVHLPAFAAAVATMTAAVWATLVLPESLPRERRVTRRMTLADINPLKTVSGKFTRGAFAPIVGAGMILTFTQTAMHGVFAFWTADAFGWTAPDVAKILVMAGVVGVLVQGGLVRVLSRVIGDRRTLLIGMVIIGGASVALGFSTTPTAVWVCMALWSIGGGLAGAAGTALFSNLAGAHEQGEAMGTNQALQGLMRVIGPLWGGWAYQHTAGLLPLGEAYRGEASGAIVQYLVPGVLTLIIAVMVWRLVPRAGGGASGAAEAPAAGEGRELP